MSKIIAVTGHRPNKLNNEYNMDGPCSLYIKNSISQIIKEEKPTKLISGMALGVDMIFAMIAIENNLPLIAAVPFVGQEKIWPQKSQKIYNDILSYAKTEKIIVCEGGYSAYKMQKRNEYMVNNCDKIIAVFDGSDGGTGNCVKYAKTINKEIIIVDPNGYKKNKR